MARTNHEVTWTEEGYKLFANEGLAGIQVERLARILSLNKSGFYHYFGDLEGFCTELIRMHEKIADNCFQELSEMKTIDPDLFHLLLKYKVAVMFQMQMFREKQHETFYKTAEQIDKTGEAILQQSWSEYLGIQDRPDLAMRYFSIVRDMFYARISFEKFDYPFLKNLFTETKVIIQQLAESNFILEPAKTRQ
jgi:AcrR family transcriptional regulator